MVCRVCLLNVKKSAVLCAQCSLISHSKCAASAPPTCDLRAQLLLYAQYAQNGNPGSAYSNPADVLHGHPGSPMSDVSYVAHTHSPRTSVDTPTPPIPTPGTTPPTAFKFMGAFKRSRSNLSPEAADAPALEKRPSKGLQRKLTKSERPQSLSSNSTGANLSMRSAATTSESAGRKSTLSAAETGAGFSVIEEGEACSPSRIASTSGRSDDAHIPGALPVNEESRRHRKTKSAGNCIVQ